MKKFIFLTAIIIMVSCVSDLSAQKLGKRIKETAKRKVEQKAEQKTEEAIDSIFNKLEKKPDKSDNAAKNQDSLELENSTSRDTIQSKKMNDDEAPLADKDQSTNMNMEQQVSDTSIFGIYSKFTFEPGNKILFYDDFEKDGLGDFPVNWETSGSGEVVTNSKYTGKWLQFSGRSGYLPITEELPENYTVEFDIVTNGFDKIGIGHALMIAFTKKKSYTIRAAGGNANLRIDLHKTSAMLISNSGAANSPRISTRLNQNFKIEELVHVSIAVNKNRLRIWLEEEKIVDIPSLLVGNMGRYFLLEALEIHPEKGYTVLVSNFKIAESKDDLRSQLLDKGRFSTTGIYFNTDKADIKPQSFAIIKSVADYLKDNPDVKIQIIGHTDAQGGEVYNQQLSDKRASSVAQVLVSQFQIDKGRLSSSGKGETEPVDDNTTEKGRANNRRVEFVKM
jgi:outer membrane protein OmpA-like peptidoglycan-associated protein